MTIRVAVADAHAPARSGLRVIVESAPGMSVVGDFATAEEMLERSAALRPDVVVMDARRPGTDSPDTAAVSRVHAELGCGVVLLTLHDDDTQLFRALAAGARGFLSAEADPQCLLAAVRAVASGGSWLSPRHTRSLIEEYGRLAGRGQETRRGASPGESIDAGRLSDREHQVLALVGEGQTNQEIAEHLTLSPHTAKTYVSRIMTKLGARDRVQLALVAAGHQVRPSPDPEQATGPGESRAPLSRRAAPLPRLREAVRLPEAVQAAGGRPPRTRAAASA